MEKMDNEKAFELWWEGYSGGDLKGNALMKVFASHAFAAGAWGVQQRVETEDRAGSSRWARQGAVRPQAGREWATGSTAR